MRKSGFPDIAMAKDASMQKLTGGACSQTWKINSSRGTFVMSIAETPMQRMKPDNVNHFEQYLWKREPELLPQPIGRIGHMPDGSFFQISRFVPAQSFDDLPGRELNDTQLANLGTALAQIHMIGAQFHHRKPMELTSATLMERLRFFLDNRASDSSPGIHLLKSKFGIVGEATCRNLGRTLKVWKGKLTGQQRGLPRSIIHGDFNHTNVLFNGDLPVIIDWTNANYDTQISEIAEMLVEFIILPAAQSAPPLPADVVFKKARTLLKAYNDLRPLTKDERDLLPDLLGLEALMVGIRPLIGQGDRYSKGTLPQGALLQDAVHVLCECPQFTRTLAELPHRAVTRYHPDGAVSRHC